MTAVAQLYERFNALGLKAVDARLGALLDQASKSKPAYADFLLDIVRYLKTG